MPCKVCRRRKATVCSHCGTELCKGHMDQHLNSVKLKEEGF